MQQGAPPTPAGPAQPAPPEQAGQPAGPPPDVASILARLGGGA